MKPFAKKKDGWQNDMFTVYTKCPQVFTLSIEENNGYCKHVCSKGWKMQTNDLLKVPYRASVLRNFHCIRIQSQIEDQEIQAKLLCICLIKREYLETGCGGS